MRQPAFQEYPLPSIFYRCTGLSYGVRRRAVEQLYPHAG